MARKRQNTANQVLQDAGAVSEPAAVYQPAQPALGVGAAAWVVRSYAAQNRDSGRPLPSPTALVNVVREGLPIEELHALQLLLGLPLEDLAPIIGVSKATLHRRRAGENLTQSESDRVVRFAKLMGLAIEVMESEEAARLWMRRPQVGLGGEVPLEYAQTEVGAREVENLLGRIEHGVYS